MTLPQAAFLILSAVALVSAVLVITRRNVVHSAIWLIVTLLSVGGIYLILQAEFLFAVQIILYVGGIMVLFLFVLMLVNVDVAMQQASFNRQWPLVLGTATLLLAELAYGLWRGRARLLIAPVPPTALAAGNTQAIGMALYQNYLLPVELASLLLLVAMVGAVLMAKKRLE
jgi:NADH-quinone oxidoreductase subunit J